MLHTIPSRFRPTVRCRANASSGCIKKDEPPFYSTSLYEELCMSHEYFYSTSAPTEEQPTLIKAARTVKFESLQVRESRSFTSYAPSS